MTLDNRAEATKEYLEREQWGLKRKEYSDVEQAKLHALKEKCLRILQQAKEHIKIPVSIQMQ